MSQILKFEEVGGFQLRPWGRKACIFPSGERKHFRKTGMVQIPKGSGHLKHVHEDADEVMYIVSGEGVHSFWDENDVETKYTVKAGDSIYICKGRFHQTVNESEEDLIIYADNVEA